MRDIGLNAHYIILFRNIRDVTQAACFGRQAFPGRGKFFMDSYKKATEEPFSYLLVDVHPRSPEVQRLQTQPEVRIENNISSLLHEKETPDDIKAKLLSDLIPKYQRVMQPPPPPKPFEIPPELLTEPELPLTNIPEVPLRINILAKYIEYAIPKTRKKYILPILETLKDANYTLNDKNEFQGDGKREYCSNVVDLFSSMMKNNQRVLTPPTGFAKFYAALRHVNIPLEWIGNKRLREQLLLSDANPAFTKITPRSPEITK
ncbi:uncharacterized protein TNCV_3180311 [Trichonephila clavipes]|uniref:Uncharacterized protein n=1 Tax=Trichonephila clavipes TaxID=2585209 RepID=A0A8X6RPA6_TRICX|nr:uncharacterized protein TNCV_3180311 [Trichonephila clavipes]